MAVTPSTKSKVLKQTPLTPKQKLEVLKEARALLNTNFGSSDWKKFVNGVERFCLYGAVQQVCGLEPSPAYDQTISSCSLTSTLYDAISPQNERKVIAERSIADIHRELQNQMNGSFPPSDYFRERCEANIMDVKVGTLQRINDKGDKRTILRIVDKEIKDLEDSL